MAGFDFTPTGSMTLESEGGAVKCEADESDQLAPGRDRPDLAIEVVFSAGASDRCCHKPGSLCHQILLNRRSAGRATPDKIAMARALPFYSEPQALAQLVSRPFRTAT